jgi:hypothetical protein
MQTSNLVHVQPGDLITSDLMNKLVDLLQSLDARVSDLESGSVTNHPPVLIGRSPTGDVEVNSPLTLIGRNFLLPSNLNTVWLNNIPINQFAASSDGQNLTFTVPDIFSPLPQTLTVFVQDQYGPSTSLQVQILPHAQTQGGQVVVFNQTPSLGQIIIGHPYDLSWLVDSQTALPVTYNLSLVFTDIVGASLAAWQANAQITPSGSRQISRGHPLPVAATITVPAGATSVNIALKAEATDHSFSQTSDAIGLLVGSTPVVSDPRALLTLLDIPPFDPATGAANTVRAATINGVSGVEVQFGASGQIPINLHVTSDTTAAGTYVYSGVVEDDASLWLVGDAVPAQSGQTAPSDREVDVTIQNTDTSNSSAIKYLVVSASHRPTGSTTTDFVSFVRFPIRGYTA